MGSSRPHGAGEPAHFCCIRTAARSFYSSGDHPLKGVFVVYAPGMTVLKNPLRVVDQLPACIESWQLPHVKQAVGLGGIVRRGGETVGKNTYSMVPAHRCMVLHFADKPAAARPALANGAPCGRESRHNPSKIQNLPGHRGKS